MTHDGSGHVAWIPLIGIMMAAFLAISGINVTSAAIGVIQSRFSVTAEQLSLVVSVYVMAEIVTMPLLSLFVRSWSVRKVSIWTLSGFAMASVACAHSQSYEQLLVSRILQGACGGLMIPLVQVSIRHYLPQNKHWKAMALFSFLAGTAPVVGPLFAGLITERTFHWLFLINLPLAGVFLSMLKKGQEPISSNEEAPPTWCAWRFVSLFIFLGSVLSFISVVEFGAQLQWWDHQYIRWGTLLFFVLLMCSVWMQWGDQDAFIKVQLFRLGSFSGLCLTSLFVGIVVYSFMYVLPLYLSVLHGYGPDDIAAVMLFTAIPQLCFSPWVARWSQHYDPLFLFSIGAACAAASCALMAPLTPLFSGEHFWWGQFLRAAAIPLLVVPLGILSLRVGSSSDAASVSILFNLFRNIGGAVGVAGTVALLHHWHVEFSLLRWNSLLFNPVGGDSVSLLLSNVRSQISPLLNASHYESFSTLFLASACALSTVSIIYFILYLKRSRGKGSAMWLKMG